MKKIVFLLLLFYLHSYGQEKPPVIINDFSNTDAGVPVSMNVLENDYCMPGHSLEFFFVSYPASGSREYGDSVILYIPDIYFDGIDSIAYIIKDKNNNMLSSIGKWYITVDNKGYDYLDINNYEARINVFGNHFWDFSSVQPVSHVPAGGDQSTLFNSVFWIGGLDKNGILHLAAEKYRQSIWYLPHMDYYPGPVMDSASYSLEQYGFWNRAWKITREEIEYHRLHWSETKYEPPEPIVTWPGNGDTILGMSYSLAPFYDQDEDGTYEPEKGEYPLIRGDQAIFFIFNDHRGEHGESLGLPLGIEIHGMAYAFDCPQDSAFQNTIFFHYTIYNRSQYHYNQIYMGIFTDLDIGWNGDDYLSTDVERNTLYAYNSTPVDGNGQPWSYGNFPPAQSVILLAGPYIDPDGIDNPKVDENSNQLCDFSYNGIRFGDGIPDNERLGMTGTVVVPLSVAPLNPYFAIDYYNLMQGIWADSIYLTYGGTGYNPSAGDHVRCRYIFPGISDTLFWGTSCESPGDLFPWTPESAGIEPSDIAGLLSSGPFSLVPSEKQEIDFAYLFARDFFNPDQHASAVLLLHRVDEIREAFINDETPCGQSFSGTGGSFNMDSQVRLFPNPAISEVTLEGISFHHEVPYIIFNMMGQKVQEGTLSGSDKNQIKLTGFGQGLYVLLIKDSKRYYTVKFIRL